MYTEDSDTSNSALDTAKFESEINDLFDSTNRFGFRKKVRSKKQKTPLLRHVVTNKTPH